MPPPPHETVHGEYEPHEVYVLLSHAHAAEPHNRASCSNVEHGVPPNCAGVTIERERVCEPPPHVTLHADQALKVLSTQSTGAGVGAGVGGTGVGTGTGDPEHEGGS